MDAIDIDSIFEARRKREHASAEEKRLAREAKAAEDKERLKHTPISVGNGRFWVPHDG